MKKITLISSLIFLLFSVKPTIAGEVTDMEWNIIDYLVVTYYDSNAKSFTYINCTAFNSKGKAIGGGRGVPSGGVARVSIEVPKKYIRKNLEVKCK